MAALSLVFRVTVIVSPLSGSVTFRPDSGDMEPNATLSDAGGKPIEGAVLGVWTYTTPLVVDTPSVTLTVKVAVLAVSAV